MKPPDPPDPLVPVMPDNTVADILGAYSTRSHIDGRVVVHVAGIHGIGSLGATRCLTAHSASLFGEVGRQPTSFVVTASYEGFKIMGAELTADLFVW